MIRYSYTRARQLWCRRNFVKVAMVSLRDSKAKINQLSKVIANLTADIARLRGM